MKALFNVFFILEILSVSVLCKSLVPEQNTLNEQFRNLVLHIVNKYFSKDMPLVVQTSTLGSCDEPIETENILDSSILQTLNEFSEHSLVTFGCLDSLDNTNKHLLKPGSFLMILADVEIESQIYFASGLAFRIKMKLGRFNVRTILISTLKSKSSIEQKKVAFELLDSMWSRDASSDVIVLLPELEFHNGVENKIPAVEIFGWLFKDQKVPCIDTLSTIKLFDRWISKKNGFQNNYDLFKVKQVTDMIGCELNVIAYLYEPYITYEKTLKKGLYQVEGLFPRMFYVIGKLLNVDFYYIDSQSNYSTGDIHVPIITGVNGTFPDDCRFTYPYFRDSLVWYIPVIKYPRWQAVIRAFTFDIWILVLLSYIFGSLTFWLFGKIRNSEGNSIIETFMNTAYTFIEIGITFKYHGNIHSVFFLLWLFYCLEIYNAYRSRLVGLLAYPGEYIPIKNLQDLENSNFHKLRNFGIYGAGMEEIISYSQCKEEFCMELLSEHNDFAILNTRYMFDIIMQNLNTKHGGRSVVKLDDPEAEMDISMMMTTGCIFIKRFDTLIKRMINTGITNKMYEDLHLFHTKVLRKFQDNEFVAVDWLHIQSPLYVLIGGMVISVVVFVCEIIYCRLRYCVRF
ncbi:hypothetical protein L9F63_010924 [Diploptera punctata]|uniref:Uncharacterized protein n=1 Tax=Diploptera punctata TaxID=6984 RepID=A0AAD8AG48_DIPPU|nr:hypothetical protein L9F63_010924 [Diploptera punctata]